MSLIKVVVRVICNKYIENIKHVFKISKPNHNVLYITVRIITRTTTVSYLTIDELRVKSASKTIAKRQRKHVQHVKQRTSGTNKLYNVNCEAMEVQLQCQIHSLMSHDHVYISFNCLI